MHALRLTTSFENVHRLVDTMESSLFNYSPQYVLYQLQPAPVQDTAGCSHHRNLPLLTIILIGRIFYVERCSRMFTRGMCMH